MNIVFLFNTREEKLAGWERPLLFLGGYTIFGHLLNQLEAQLPTAHCLLVSRSGQAELQSAVEAKLPNVTQVNSDSGLRAGLQAALPHLQPGGTLLLTDRALTTADFSALVDPERDGAVARQLVKDGQPAGPVWLREVTEVKSVATDSEAVGLLADLHASLEPISSLEADHYFPLHTPDDILHTARRFLGLGATTPEALERSYAEEFAVIPPVYLHPSAVVEASVIGPYASIGPGAVIRDSVVRHSLVADEAEVSGLLLDHALVGRRGVLRQPPVSYQLPDGQQRRLAAVEEAAS